MRCLVTGCAGFIGSHLAERLIAQGKMVLGLDCFADYYARELKEQNLAALRGSPEFHFVEADLLDIDLAEILSGVDWVFHLAAQPGVRGSWGPQFDVYVRNNIRATQRLLEASKTAVLKKLVYASSSSVYGDAPTYPTDEDSPLLPVSPYGVTKLAAENLCYLYWRNFGVPAVSVRYFTVYGPRQRPDMAIAKFIRAILDEKEISIYGDGGQARDFTYVADAVEGTIRAAERGVSGQVYNLGGNSSISVNELIRLLEGHLSKRASLTHLSAQHGDVRDTRSSIAKSQRNLGYSPKVAIAEGLRGQTDFAHRQRLTQV